MHLDIEGKTCERCSDTGKEVRDVVQRLNEECRGRGVEIKLKETTLSEDEISKSNLILINGRPIEDILPDAERSESGCCSCSELTGKEESCRTILQFGEVFETIPQKLIREAICEIAGCC